MTRRCLSFRWQPNWPGCIRRPCVPTTGWAWSRRDTPSGVGATRRDIARLRLIQRLSQDEGINLEGIRRILHMQDDIDELRARVEQLTSLLATLQSGPASRVFTADPIGGVHLGRRGRRAPLALPGRPLP